MVKKLIFDLDLSAYTFLIVFIYRIASIWACCYPLQPGVMFRML